jgi:hypothetical protein
MNAAIGAGGTGARLAVGHDLTRMVRAAMPAGWTPAERLVALLLADICNDRTRKPAPGYQVTAALLAESGLKESALSHVLGSLAAKGCELRVPISTDKRGRPVYAAKGHSVDYRFPMLPPRELEGRTLVQALGSKAAPSCDLNGHSPHDAASFEGQRSHAGATPNPKRPNTPNSQNRPDQALAVPVAATSVEGVPASEAGHTKGALADAPLMDEEAERRRQQDALTAWIRENGEAS